MYYDDNIFANISREFGLKSVQNPFKNILRNYYFQKCKKKVMVTNL